MKNIDVCLGFKSGATRDEAWKTQTNPLSNGIPFMIWLYFKNRIVNV